MDATSEGEELAQLRALCLALPEVEERISHGEPTWFIKGKRSFATFADHHHGARFSFWCAAPPGLQEALVGSEPSKFFRPPYVGPRGWLGVYLDVPLDWSELGELIETAYRAVAPAKLAAQLDS